jgi:hypothetical protein
MDWLHTAINYNQSNTGKKQFNESLDVNYTSKQINELYFCDIFVLEEAANHTAKTNRCQMQNQHQNDQNHGFCMVK